MQPEGVQPFLTVMGTDWELRARQAIQRLEGTSRAFVAIGGETGTLYRTLLEAEGIDISVFEVAGNTRQSFAIVETSTGKQYRFQLPGQVWSAARRIRRTGSLGWWDANRSTKTPRWPELSSVCFRMLCRRRR